MKKCNLQHPNSKIRSELSRVLGCVFKKCGNQEEYHYLANGIKTSEEIFDNKGKYIEYKLFERKYFLVDLGNPQMYQFKN